MKKGIHFTPIDKENWEDTLILKVHPEQQKFVPSVAESLASAYIKPWDEALDPFAIYNNDILIGCFYLSYTPESKDNYWIGGFFIDKRYQGKGFGKMALCEILKFIPTVHTNCIAVNLTVEKDNIIAQKLYRSLGFSDTGTANKYGEIIYILKI